MSVDAVSDSTAAQLAYIMKQWCAARRRFKDVPQLEIGAQLSGMFAKVVSRAEKELSTWTSDGGSGDHERYSQMLKELKTKMPLKISELTD
jgi:hypothetical protein